MDLMGIYEGLGKLEIARQTGAIQADFFRVQMFRELMGIAHEYFEDDLSKAVESYNAFKGGKTVAKE